MKSYFVEILVNELKAENSDHFLNVVKALADMGQKKAVPSLVSTLKTLNQKKTPLGDRIAIRNALKKLTNQDFSLDDEAWLKWWEAEGQN